MKNVLIPLPKNVLISLGLTISAATTDAAIRYKMNDIMNLVKSLEESGSLIRGLSETIKMKQNNKQVDFSAYYWVNQVLVYKEMVTGKVVKQPNSSKLPG